MKTTIDKAGRVVIPARLRTQAGFLPGIELEVTAEGFAIRLERAAPGPRLIRRGNRRIARPVATEEIRPEVDVAALIAAERDRWT